MIAKPQPGSTAAVGNISEGVYEDASGYTLIEPTGTLVRIRRSDWIWGSIAVTDANWVFNPGTQKYAPSGAPAVTGSGTFSAKSSMDGSYSTGGRPSEAWGPLKYSAANALAVTQEGVTGKWRIAKGTDTVAIDIDAKGAFVGETSGVEFGICKLAGTLTQLEPKTGKNMYQLTLTAVNAATGTLRACSMDTTSAYAGPAAIILSPAGAFVGNGYFRSLVLTGQSDRNLMSVVLDKVRN